MKLNGCHIGVPTGVPVRVPMEGPVGVHAAAWEIVLQAASSLSSGPVSVADIYPRRG